MSKQTDLTPPIDVLMTTQGQNISDEPDGPGSLVMHHLSRVSECPVPQDMQFQAEMEMLTRGDMPGSLQGKLPNLLYVFSRGRNPDKPLEMAKVGYTKSLFVVSNRVKIVLETLTLKNSEFYPVSMVYSNKGVNSEDWGGGPVIAGTHWLWWCYATFDLVDVENTEAILTPMAEPNRALPGNPSVQFHHIGRVRNGPPPKVALKNAPYEESAAFTILGWPSAPMIVSPAFGEAFADAGLIDPAGPISIGVLPLDGPRYAKVNVDFQKKLIARKPLLRVFGTDIVAADRHEPPFHSSRSPNFPLPSQES